MVCLQCPGFLAQFFQKFRMTAFVHSFYAHQYKYLGFWINEFLDNSESTQKVCDHANRVPIAKSKFAGGLPVKVFSQLFNTLVLSRIEYTAAIWACRSFLLLNQIQHNALFLD